VEVTEVRVKLMEEPGERLQGFCSITLDNCFVVRDLKIIEGTSGPFVAMPSRKLTAHCPGCGSKNHLRAAFCNHCGRRLQDDRVAKDEDGRAKLYADIAHPINSRCREMIQDRVISAFRDEVERSKLPGYVPSYDDFDDDVDLDRVSRRAKPAACAAQRPAENTKVDKTKIDAAEPQPRAPHQIAARLVEAPPETHTAAARSAAPQPAGTVAASRGNGFGAGIW
jgi:stage V sporulation protein G